MSKYREMGDYHFKVYSDPNSEYRQHVDDLINRLLECLDYDMTATILDIGCGEGLVVSLLRTYGYDAEGVDADKWAVAIAAAKGMGEYVRQEHSDGSHHGYNVVMFLDSLEHMANWSQALLNASLNAEVLVIAVPDRHDKHAVTQDLGDQVLDYMKVVGGFRLEHKSQRHARHFFIFRKMP